MAPILCAEPQPLWPGLATGEKVATEDVLKKSADGRTRLSKVSVPSLEVFHAEKTKASGVAVLVCPGGGYNILAIDHEGKELCRWLSKNGITGVLLKYRVPRRVGRSKHEAPLEDAQRAITIIRENAELWGIDRSKVVVMGFSAGGHLAAVLLSNPKRNYTEEKKYRSVSSKPDFGILVYPAYIRENKKSHTVAPELKFTKDTPPVFITVAKSDQLYYPDSALLADVLVKLRVPVKYHVFDSGGHGFGMGTTTAGNVREWPGICLKWLKEHSILPE